MASCAQLRATQNADCYLNSTRKPRSTHLPRVMWNDHHVVETGRPTGHPAVGIKRKLRPNSRPPHHPIKIRAEESGVICTTSDRPWIVEQDTQDRSMDREGVPRGTTTATYSDVINPTMPGPNAADGLHQSYAATRPDTEVPHTLSASRTRYWITNSSRVSSPSISNHMTAQPIPQYGSRISSSTSTWPEETTSTPSNISH